MVVPSESSTRKILDDLIARKDIIERNINELGNILKTNKDVGMTESLVDDTGCPRNDIDVYQVRHARHQIICLQNDLKDLMKQIHKKLEEYHGEVANRQNITETFRGIQLSENMENNLTEPIVKVNFVSQGSPGEIAGIRVDDEIIEFGSVNKNTFKDLSQIGDIVKHRKDQNISLKIRRDNMIYNLNLVPKIWNGRGLLGFNIIPIVENV